MNSAVLVESLGNDQFRARVEQGNTAPVRDQWGYVTRPAPDGDMDLIARAVVLSANNANIRVSTTMDGIPARTGDILVFNAGVVVFDPSPESARLELSGTTSRAVTGRSQFIVPAGPYAVRVTAPGYLAHSGRLTIDPGRIHNLASSLQRRTWAPAMRCPGGNCSISLRGGQRLPLVSMPDGSFIPGEWRNTGASDQRPARRVQLKGFRIGATEVTVGQFRRFVDETGHVTAVEVQGFGFTKSADGMTVRREGISWKEPGFPQSDDHPVVLVTKNDAMQFADWIGARLPTEAEWEYAARNGGEQVIYPWGDQLASNTANFADRTSGFANAASNLTDDQQYTAAVRTYPGSSAGLFDMAGNVSEWCLNPGTGGKGLIRGGSWAEETRFMRTTTSNEVANENVATTWIGFRVVMQ